MFLKYRSSSHDFNKLVIKFNLHAKLKDYFYDFSSMLNYANMIYFFRNLSVCNLKLNFVFGREFAGVFSAIRARILVWSEV
jgi:hypothetical protein